MTASAAHAEPSEVADPSAPTPEGIAKHADIRRLALRVVARVGVPAAHHEDVAQEAVTKITRAWPTFDPRKGTLGAWAATIARNEARGFLRRSKRDLLAQADADGALDGLTTDRPPDREAEEVLELVAEAGPDSRRGLEAAWRAARDKHANSVLAKMKLHEARVVYLRLWCDLTEEQAADVEGISVRTASTRFWDGVRRAERALAREGAGGIVSLLVAVRLFRGLLRLDDPPTSEPPPPSGMRGPSSGVGGVDPTVEPSPPASGRTWPLRLVDQLGGALVGGMAVLLLVLVPNRHPHATIPAPHQPAALMASAPGRQSAEVPEAAAPTVEREAPRASVPSEPAQSGSGGAVDDAAIRLYNRALRAADTQNYDEALRWLMQHRQLHPDKMPSSRERLVRSVCDALHASGSSDPRCP